MAYLLKSLHILVYLIYRCAVAVARVLPIALVFLLGKIIGGIANRLLFKRRRLAEENLRIALGKSHAEARRLVRQHFMLLGANLFSMLKISTMCDEQISRHVTVEIAPEIPPIDEIKGFVAVLSHMGNWELLSHLSRVCPQYRFGALYQPLANDYLDAHLRKTRTRSGITLFDRREEFWKSIAFLESGGVLGVLADQYAGTTGIWMPFFGRLTSTSSLPAMLAQRVGVDLVPIVTKTTGLACWHVKVGLPVKQGGSTEETTGIVNRMLESEIRTTPADWLWTHNRWKTPRFGFLLSAARSRIYFPQGFDFSSLIPYSVLIRSVDEHAEALAALPIVQAIKRGRPDSHVTIVSPNELVSFWREIQEVDEVISIADEETVFSVARKIARSGRFDVGILLPKKSRGALEMLLAGVPYRFGAPRRFILNYWKNAHGVGDPQPLGKERYQRIAQAAGAAL